MAGIYPILSPGQPDSSKRGAVNVAIEVDLPFVDQPPGARSKSIKDEGKEIARGKTQNVEGGEEKKTNSQPNVSDAVQQHQAKRFARATDDRTEPPPSPLPNSRGKPPQAPAKGGPADADRPIRPNGGAFIGGSPGLRETFGKGFLSRKPSGGWMGNRSNPANHHARSLFRRKYEAFCIFIINPLLVVFIHCFSGDVT